MLINRKLCSFNWKFLGIFEFLHKKFLIFNFYKIKNIYAPKKEI